MTFIKITELKDREWLRSKATLQLHLYRGLPPNLTNSLRKKYQYT